MSTDTLREEHELQQRAVLASRRKFAASPVGAFVQAMMQGMDDYHKARAAGMSKEEACRGLEAVLRDCWPKPTTKFPPLCETCNGTGYRDMVCWHEHRCERANCRKGHPAFEHNYVVPCECRPMTAPDEQDAIMSAGRGSRKRKPTGWTKL